MDEAESLDPEETRFQIIFELTDELLLNDTACCATCGSSHNQLAVTDIIFPSCFVLIPGSDWTKGPRRQARSNGKVRSLLRIN